MLRILDGQECRLDAKYGEVLNKTRNVPIVLIVNQIPSKMRSYGPMQERVMRLRFNSRIANIDEALWLTTKQNMRLRVEFLTTRFLSMASDFEADWCGSTSCMHNPP